MKKEKIAVIAGGFSKEKKISIKTGVSVFRELKKNGHKVIMLEPDGLLIKNLSRFKPDVVFNALHGRYGEDGFIQLLLEKEKFKYTHSGVLSSYIAINKILSKKIFIKNKILTPKFVVISRKDKFKDKIVKKIKKKLGFPVVVKPVNEGSSVDVFICDEKNLSKNIHKLRQYKDIIVEEFIGGREIQAAILGEKKIGIIELKPKRQFYDYEAKYKKSANTKHLIPVNIKRNEFNDILSIAMKAHKGIGCKSVTRSDFKFYKNKFYLLEINTQPGMTNLSLVPEIAKFNGISFYKLIIWMIKDASI